MYVDSPNLFSGYKNTATLVNEILCGCTGNIASAIGVLAENTLKASMINRDIPLPILRQEGYRNVELTNNVYDKDGTPSDIWVYQDGVLVYMLQASQGMLIDYYNTMRPLLGTWTFKAAYNTSGITLPCDMSLTIGKPVIDVQPHYFYSEEYGGEMVMFSTSMMSGTYDYIGMTISGYDEQGNPVFLHNGQVSLEDLNGTTYNIDGIHDISIKIVFLNYENYYDEGAVEFDEAGVIESGCGQVLQFVTPQENANLTQEEADLLLQSVNAKRALAERKAVAAKDGQNTASESR